LVSLICFGLIWLLNHGHKVRLYVMLLINDKILKETMFTLWFAETISIWVTISWLWNI